MLHNSRRFFSDWVPDFVIRRAKVILIGAFFLTAGLAAYSVLNFRIDTGFDALVSSDLSSQRSLTDFEKLFPQLNETLVVVVEGKTPEKTSYARDFLVDRFRKHPNAFRSVFAPGGGPFYQQNGLLYLGVNELADLGDRLAEVQPFLGLLSRELSLETFFEMMSQILAESSGAPDAERLDVLLSQMASTVG
jgi:hypothetical protein